MFGPGSVLLTTLVVSTVGHDAHASLGASGRHLQRPVAQQGVDSTVSFAQRTFTWPAGGGLLDFDYFVDSETGYDFLRVLIDGALTNSWSGPSVAGHVRRAMSGGSHTVRVEYLKDSSVSRGLDLGWIDDIAASDGAGTLVRDDFDGRSAVLATWSAGGAGGGFAPFAEPSRRALSRPTSQAFAGWQSSPTSSNIERSFTCASATCRIGFDYVVDSEQSYDYLRVYLDGVLQWQTSGQEAGRRTVELQSQGTHVIRFEYLKDTSVDVGRDMATVDNVVLESGDGVVERHSLDGHVLGQVPNGWTAGGAAGGWSVGPAASEAVLIARDSSAAPPTVDGWIEPSTELAHSTALALFDRGNPNGRMGKMYLRESEAEQALYLAARVHASTSNIGGESGAIAIYFDAARGRSLAWNSCSGTPTANVLPASEDRKLYITYSSGSGNASVVVTQFRGSCSPGSPWVPIQPGAQEEWPVTTAIGEPERDHGYLHIELRLALVGGAPSAALSEGRIGFAFQRISAAASPQTEESYPFSFSSDPAIDADVSRWVTLEFGAALIGEDVVAQPAHFPAFP